MLIKTNVSTTTVHNRYERKKVQTVNNNHNLSEM